MTINMNVDELSNILETTDKESVKSAAKASIRIAAFIISLGLIGYILFKFGWPIMEFIMLSWFPLFLIMVVLLCTGVISVETYNMTWGLFKRGANKTRESVEWAINELKRMQAERKTEKSL